MSRIQSIVSNIKQFLQGENTRIPEKIRIAAEEYAAAVEQLSNDLKECESLIKTGLYSEARKFAYSMTPSLNIRAKTVVFPEMKQWKEFCIQKHLSVPADIDVEILNELEVSDERALQIEDLAVQWRKIARDGSPLEKAELLRKIIAGKSDGNIKIWEKNLLNVEKKLLPWLLQHLRKALEQKDYLAAEKYLQELKNPNLHSKPNPEIFLELENQYIRWKKEETKKESERFLVKIDTACAERNRKDLELYLKEWEGFRKTPYLELTVGENERLNDAKKWITECQAKDKEDEEFLKVRQKLQKAIDEEWGFPEIDKLYNTLKAFDRPVPELLVERYQSLRDGYQLQMGRKHVRICIYGILGAVLLILLVGSIISFTQAEREHKNIIQQMLHHLSYNDPESVIKFYTELEAKDPVLAKKANVKSIYNDAKNMMEKFKKEQQEIDRLIASLSGKINEKYIEQDFVKKDFEKLNGLKIRGTAKQLDQLRDLEDRWKQMLVKVQLDREKIFNQICEKTGLFIDKQFDLIQKTDSVSELNEINDQLDSCKQQYTTHFTDAEKIPEHMRKNQEKILDSKYRTAKNFSGQKIKQIMLRKELYEPKSFEYYLDALKKVQTDLPEDEAALWTKAIKTEPFWAQLTKVLFTNETFTVPAKYKEMEQLLLTIPENPFSTDFQKLPCPENMSTKIQKYLSVLENDLMKDCNFYELIFTGNDQKKYRFYTKTIPILHERPKGYLRMLELDAVLRLNDDTESIIFKIKTEKGSKFHFIPEEQAIPGLPKEFTELNNVHGTRIGEWHKAEHYLFLKKMLPRLKATAQDRLLLKKETIEIFEELIGNSRMNIYIKAMIAEKILGILQEIEPEIEVSPILNRLSNLLKTQNFNWLNPVEEANHKDAVETINQALKETDLKELTRRGMLEESLRKTALLRNMEPVGIIYQGKDNKYKLYSLVQTMPPEIWILSEESTFEDRLYALQPDSFKQDLPKDFRKEKYLFHGQILFAPADYQKTEDLVKRKYSAPELKIMHKIKWPFYWPSNKRSIK